MSAKANTVLVFFLLFFHISAQRISTHGDIGWYNVFGTFQISEKFGLHTEYQWRRDSIIFNWQQSLLRVGINYRISPRLLARVGYGWIETFNYGEIPIHPLGKDFTEHRIFQMVQITTRMGRSEWLHRCKAEQRFIGQYSNPSLTHEDIFISTHRVRYMLRYQINVVNNAKSSSGLYFAAYDELFISLGRIAQRNHFDQNRFALLMGYRFTPSLAIEAGYFNQILQLVRNINGSNVYQFNDGIIVNAVYTIGTY